MRRDKRSYIHDKKCQKCQEGGIYLGLGGGVTNVLAHEVVPSGDHDVSLSAVSHALQDLPHAQRNGGLTRARGTGEAHVQGRHSRVEAELATHLHTGYISKRDKEQGKSSASYSAVGFVWLKVIFSYKTHA